MNESHETTASKLKYKNNQWVASQGDENWLVVLNPEIINKLPIPAQNHLPDTTDKIFPQEGVEYDWPGTMKKQKFPFLDGGWKDGYILSLPETTASGDTAKQGRRYRELINYIQNVTKGTIHEHSPHTQDLLRFLNSEIDLVEKAFSYGYWSNGVSKQTSWEQFKRDNGI
jgi:hypothetical protein